LCRHVARTATRGVDPFSANKDLCAGLLNPRKTKKMSRNHVHGELDLCAFMWADHLHEQRPSLTKQRPLCGVVEPRQTNKKSRNQPYMVISSRPLDYVPAEILAQMTCGKSTMLIRGRTAMFIVPPSIATAIHATTRRDTHSWLRQKLTV